MKKQTFRSVGKKTISIVLSLACMCAILCGMNLHPVAEQVLKDKQLTHNALYTKEQIEDYNYKDWGMPLGERTLFTSNGRAYLRYLNTDGYGQARTPLFDAGNTDWSGAAYVAVPVKNNTDALADFLPMFFMNEESAYVLKAGAEIIYQTGKFIYSEPLPEASGTVSYISIPSGFDGTVYIPVSSDAGLYEPLFPTDTAFDVTSVVQMGTYFRSAVDLLLGDYRLMYSAPELYEKQITNLGWLNQDYVESLLGGIGTVTLEGDLIHIVKPAGYTNGLLPWLNAYNTDFSNVKYVTFEVDNTNGTACNILPAFDMITSSGEDIFSMIRTNVIYNSADYRRQINIDNGSFAYVEIPAGFKGSISMEFSQNPADYLKTWSGNAADSINTSNMPIMRLFMNYPEADFLLGNISVSFGEPDAVEAVRIYDNASFTDDDINNGNNTEGWGLNGTKTRVQSNGISYINIKADGGRAIYPVFEGINSNWLGRKFIEIPIKNNSGSEAFVMPYFFINNDTAV
ncbi:MAG: hypothetical protein ACI4F7_08690, partial [Acutalibacteraceae bacterium]